MTYFIIGGWGPKVRWFLGRDGHNRWQGASDIRSAQRFTFLEAVEALSGIEARAHIVTAEVAQAVARGAR